MTEAYDALAYSVIAAARRIDPSLAIGTVKSMDRVLAESVDPVSALRAE